MTQGLFVGKITVGRADIEVEGLQALVTTMVMTLELGKVRKLSQKQN